MKEPLSLEINHLYHLGRGTQESKYLKQENQRFTPPPKIKQDKYGLDQLAKEEYNSLPGLTSYSKLWNAGNYA